MEIGGAGILEWINGLIENPEIRIYILHDENISLKVQLVAKNIIKYEEWEDLRYNIRFDFLEDNHYSELKDAELLTGRITLLQQIDPYIGRFYSDEWIKRNLLRMTDDDIELMDKQIKSSLETNITFAQNKGEQQLAQQQPTMEFQANQQAAMQQQQVAAQQEAQAQQTDDDQQKKVVNMRSREGKQKATGEQKDQFDWSN